MHQQQCNKRPTSGIVYCSKIINVTRYLRVHCTFKCYFNTLFVNNHWFHGTQKFQHVKESVYVYIIPVMAADFLKEGILPISINLHVILFQYRYIYF